MALSKYDKDLLLDLYRTMLTSRRFDQELIRLLHDGKVGGFHHSGQGHEAIAAGICASLEDKDYLFYHHRGCNQQISKGISLEGIYADFLGRVDGTTGGLGSGIVHHVDPDKGILGQSGTIGESYILAAGVGYSIKYRGTDQVCVAFNGDGATAREVFHGGINWVGLYNLPVIYVIENNLLASSLHFQNSHSLKEGGSLADRADSYDVPSFVVDGNDVLAVYEVAKEAIARARNPKERRRCTLIEAMTYRYRGHFEGDSAEYMDKDVIEEWRENRDPLDNYRKKLLDSGTFNEKDLTKLEKEVDDTIKNAIAKAEASPIPGRDRIFEGLYA
ncbi:MAG: thiamine pyrophosphate-dependent dehydrogenase E1 component subunit alpha [Firmicutes bacterium]|jgi:TPP-dependent pyruvate/acetoin dehydrogenase alpha subunit|nr:thiamine pyrophosphate-dependent dehydrogenase E1 component subunit alpha [Bacillota bacterium]